MTSLRSFFVVTALASACTAALAAPSLPSPDGGYPVGVVRTEFADPTRLLDAADPDSGPRRLPAVVWYPAVESAPVDGAAYLAPEAVTTTVPAISRLFRYPLPEVETLVDVRTAAGLHARPATQTGGFPVVVYSHGLFLYPEQNTALAMLLASHGYIVVSIAHPGDSADLRLRDGRLVATDRRSPSTPWRAAATAGASSTRAARDTVTTRPPRASFLSTPASSSTGAPNDDGCCTSVSPRTTAE